MKIAFVVAALIASTTLAASAIISRNETPKEKKERLDEICEQLMEEGEPEEQAVGPHVKAGKAAEWVINNTNKPDGWSFTGYAKLNIDENGNRSRWKFGVINGELDWATHDNIFSGPADNWEAFEEWNRRKTDDVVFGIFFVKEF